MAEGLSIALCRQPSRLQRTRMRRALRAAERAGTGQRGLETPAAAAWPVPYCTDHRHRHRRRIQHQHQRQQSHQQT